MDIYLPIAGMSVNALVMVLAGAGVGFLSGLFGVGGGFLLTPFLIFYGVPPAVAVASSAPQITGSSVSAVLAHARRGGVDYKMGMALVVGGFIGSALGARLFRWLQQLGQIDLAIQIVYVLLLGTIGTLMARDSLRTLRQARATTDKPRPLRRAHRHIGVIAGLPMRMKFPASGLYLSPLAPIILGALVGVLTVIMGVGGGFVLVPAMVYLLGMSAGVVVGTSLLQIVFVTAVTTLFHAVQSGTVDIVLAALLLLGGVVGAQYGARAARKLPAEKLRLGLAVVLLAFATRLVLQLTYRPGELFSVSIDEGA
ncbi:MAG: sulfite exporter TauE/SafE family protein [Sphingomonadaceae bacterium]|nr:sulfite exporter TauE/SafE family protein [Sphingomonadaceae bacterium]